MFHDRKHEMALLDRCYNSDRAELFVLHGRRRVGKTELLRNWCGTKPTIFYIATLSSSVEQLAIFSQQVYAFTHGSAPVGFTYPSWEAAFSALAEIPQTPRPVVILDEFTYLISSDKAIPSILQKIWDEILIHTRIILVLCGSFIGMMETEVLDYRAPLYGRRTASTLLKPLNFPASRLFFPNYSDHNQFLSWAILGGMPYYLNTFTDQMDIFDNIQSQILNVQSGILYNEPRLLLMEELREPRIYFSILRAIAQGRTRLNEISQEAGGMENTSTSKYLDVLQQLKLINRKVPATETVPEKSKRGLYQINDHFLRFWFRYVLPNQSAIELGMSTAVLNQKIKPDFNHFVSSSFEEAAIDFIAQQANEGLLPFLPERIGGWWNNQSEIDLVAINQTEKTALIAECKWSQNPIEIKTLNELKQKGTEFQKYTNIETLSYALFSRSGFSPDVRDAAVSEKTLLFSVEDINRY